METLIVAATTGLVSSLLTWGGLRVELRWLRRDVDLAHQRIDRLEGKACPA